MLRSSLGRSRTRIARTRGAFISSSALSSGSAGLSVGSVGTLIPNPLELFEGELDFLVPKQRRGQPLPFNLTHVDFRQDQARRLPRHHHPPTLRRDRRRAAPK